MAARHSRGFAASAESFSSGPAVGPSERRPGVLPHIVLTWCATARGGAERSVPEVAAELAAAGLPVTVVWWRFDGGPGPVGAEGVTVVEATDYAQYEAALSGALVAGAAAVISNHRTMLADVRIAPPHVPVIAVVRGILSPTQAFRVVDPDTGLLVEHTPASLPWSVLADGVARWVGISDASAASIRAAAPAQVPVVAIYNGVSIPVWRPAPWPDTAAVRFVVVGRSVPWKRVDAVVDAVGRMREPERVRLDVYGEAGSQQPQLEALAARGPVPVAFRGWVGDLPRHIAGAHALVSASVAEGFGRGVLDAAGVAVPAVVPAAGAGPELVLDGLTGFTYDPDDPDALVAALDRVAAMGPAEIARLGWAARSRAVGRFSPARCADEYLALCHRLIAERALVGTAR